MPNRGLHHTYREDSCYMPQSQSKRIYHSRKGRYRQKLLNQLSSHNGQNYITRKKWHRYRCTCPEDMSACKSFLSVLCWIQIDRRGTRSRTGHQAGYTFQQNRIQSRHLT